VANSHLALDIGPEADGPLSDLPLDLRPSAG
jgi:hypothetical protein